MMHECDLYFRVIIPYSSEREGCFVCVEEVLFSFRVSFFFLFCILFFPMLVPKIIFFNIIRLRK